MKLKLKVIRAGNVNGKVNKKIFKQDMECEFQEAIDIVKNRYGIDSEDWRSYIDYDNHRAEWKSITEFGNGMMAGIRIILGEEENDDEP